MRAFFRPCVWLAGLMTAMACSNSDDTASETDALSPAGGGDEGGAGGSAENADEGEDTPGCQAPDPILVAEGELRSLEVMGDAIYYIRQAEDGPNSIVWHPTASSAAQTLHPAVEGRSPIDLLVTADTLYVLAEQDLDWVLYRGPLSGGELTPLGEPLGGSLLIQGLLGVLGDEIFFEDGRRVRAMSLTDGSVRWVTGEIDDSSLQLAASRIWFTEYDVPASDTALISHDVSAPQPTPVRVVEGGCSTRRLGHDVFVVTDAGIYCTNRGALERVSLDGATREELWPEDELGLGSVAFVDGDTVYLTRGLRVDLGAGTEIRHSCVVALSDSVLPTRTHVVWGTGSSLAGNSNAYFQSTIESLYALPK